MKLVTVAVAIAGQQRLKADHVELLHVAMPTASEASAGFRWFETTSEFVKTDQNMSELSVLITCVANDTMP